MKEQGRIYFYGYDETFSINRKFELEDDIPVESYNKDYLFIDVCSGPFSRCGKMTDKVNLNPLFVDLSENIYNIIKGKNNINNGTKIASGFVELLSMDFPENTFDMVYMSNSADNSFNPIYSIYQLLYIYKIGGKVILRHTKNEAKYESYNGLRQWNPSLKNPKNSFLIWRNGQEFSYNELLCKKIRTLFYNPNYFIEKMKSENINCVDIYGIGDVVKSLYVLLKKCGINIGQIVDKKSIQYNGMTTISFTKYKPDSKMDWIIITPQDKNQKINKMILEKVDKSKIVYINDS